MVSKCANPECSAKFLYLHQGKIYLLTPPRELENMSEHEWGLLEERFWLCDRCCKTLKVVWGGKQPELVPLVEVATPPPPASDDPRGEEDLEKRAVSAMADV